MSSPKRRRPIRYHLNWILRCPSSVNQTRSPHSPMSTIKMDLLNRPWPRRRKRQKCKKPIFKSISTHHFNLIAFLSRNSKDIPQEERDRAIKRVTEEHISPGIVGEDIGVTASAVRSWIKGAGLTLPAKYKQVQKKTQPVKETPQPLPAEIPQQTAPPQPQPAPLTASTQPNNLPYNNPTHPANTNLNQLYAQPQPHPVGPPGFQASNVNNFRPQMQQNHRGPRPPPQGVIRLPMGSPQKSPLTLIPARSDSPTVKDGKVSADGLKPGEKYTPRYVAGKLKLCRNCGSTSADFNRCEACRKPLPDDCKIVTDHNQKRDSVRHVFVLYDKALCVIHTSLHHVFSRWGMMEIQPCRPETQWAELNSGRVGNSSSEVFESTIISAKRRLRMSRCVLPCPRMKRTRLMNRTDKKEVKKETNREKPNHQTNQVC